MCIWNGHMLKKLILTTLVIRLDTVPLDLVSAEHILSTTLPMLPLDLVSVEQISFALHEIEG